MSPPPDAFPLRSPSALMGSEGGHFFTTHWTMVLEAGADRPGRDAAMEQFALAYWYPIYAFVRKKGHDAEEAQDLTQGFFAQLVEKDWLAGVERRETRFSTWLLQLLSRYLVSDYRKQVRLKRGGGGTPMSLDALAAENFFGQEPHTDESPERIFERKCALAVLRNALERMRAELQGTGRGRQFAAISPFLSREPERGEYEAVSTTLDISTGAVASAVQRLRREYRAAVRQEVAAGLTNSEQIDEEMRNLADALSA